MTINNCPGQSLSTVCMYFPKSVFAHEQLYVAVSRVKSKWGLNFFYLDSDGKPSIQQMLFTKKFFEICNYKYFWIC
ncbi:hypothetical protein ACS0TY_028965 [Phlomoides rotata]